MTSSCCHRVLASVGGRLTLSSPSASSDAERLRRLALAAATASALSAVVMWPTFKLPSQCDERHRCATRSRFLLCEQAEPGLARVVMTMDSEKVGLHKDVANVLGSFHLDVITAQLSTHDGKSLAVYRVRGKDSVSLPSEARQKLAQAIESLGVSCSVEPWKAYTREEVSRHTTKETRIWVSYKNGVYDITDFLPNHPGGTEKIMLAAGKSIDPFWRLYQQHENRGNAVAQLENFRIGDLSDPEPVDANQKDLFSEDPERHPGLIFHNNKPCNAELPVELLMDSWLTPNPVWFIRHHHPVPVVDPEKFRLRVESDSGGVSLSIDDLKTRFVKREIVSTIQCGGNRRSELDKIEKTSGISWGVGAMSTARWGGVYLSELLVHCAGVNIERAAWSNLQHVVFHGLDDMQASIPIEKALNPFGDVLVAYEMNGEPLPPEHGFPARVIVPGVVGVRNVKWVGRIRASQEEAEGPWQRGIAYKGFSPMVRSLAGVEVEKILSMQEMPVQSTIMSPMEGAKIELDEIEVKGIAWSGGGRGIVRVDVSTDDGKTWITADLLEGKEQHPMRSWAWTFWEASVPVPEAQRGKEVTVLCRATDASYTTQPESAAPLWNLRGLNCNCWHRVTVRHSEE